MYSKDGKILLALANPERKGTYAGSWRIIGGGMENGETDRQTLDREILEETGIDISSYPIEFIHAIKGEAEKTLKETGERVFVNMNFRTYKVFINDKNAEEIKVTLDDEHSEYRWVDPSELKSLHLAPPNIPLFTLLGYL